MSLLALTPPEFNSCCAKCGSRAKILPWSFFSEGSWGPICDSCARPLLLQLLQTKLDPRFRETDVIAFLVGFGLGKKQSQLIVVDFVKQGSIVMESSGLYCWSELTVIEPLYAQSKKRKRVWRSPSQKEIFLRCEKLARELMLGFC